jgi:hypothetical protein
MMSELSERSPKLASGSEHLINCLQTTIDAIGCRSVTDQLRLADKAQKHLEEYKKQRKDKPPRKHG